MTAACRRRRTRGVGRPQTLGAAAALEPTHRRHAAERATKRSKLLAGRHKDRRGKGGKKVLDSRRPRSIVPLPSFNAPGETNGAKEESSASLTDPSEQLSLFGGKSIDGEIAGCLSGKLSPLRGEVL